MATATIPVSNTTKDMFMAVIREAGMSQKVAADTIIGCFFRGIDTPKANLLKSVADDLYRASKDEEDPTDA